MSQTELEETVAQQAKELAELKAKATQYEDDFFVIANQPKGASGKVIIGYASLVDNEYKGEMRKGLATVIEKAVKAGKTMAKISTCTYMKDEKKCVRVGLSLFGEKK